MEDFLTALTGDRKLSKRFLNPIKSDYQKRLERRGWEFVGNEGFYSMMDDMEPLELVWGDEIILAENSLKEKMIWKREWLRNIHSAEKVRFMRAYDIDGNRIPKEELYVGVYIKRRVS